MPTSEVSTGWSLDVDRGPDWLFVTVRRPDAEADIAPHLAEAIWSIMQRHFVSRLVLELSEIDHLHSHLIGQLVLLHKRITSRGGVLRVCGLSPGNEAALHASRLDSRFPNYRNREEAVLGHRPLQPR